MSFILDALRKSERERQRETVANPSHAPLATGRHRIPVWTWLLISLLSLTLIALAAAFWRSDQGALPATTLIERPPVIADSPPREDQPALDSEPAIDTPPRLRPIGELANFDPSLPALRLELLAYNNRDPASGSAWINGRRYLVGEKVANGPELIEVRSDSVVLSFAGEQFLLTTR